MLLERYREFLPITDRTPLLTLNEGNTPLIAAPRMAAALGVRELHLKFEGLNPTGSFKDRGMVMAVAKALEEGATSIICASTGNTSASAAAYAARAGIEAIVVVPAGKIALGKLAQALMYGARLLVIEGNFDQALSTVCELADRYPPAISRPTGWASAATTRLARSPATRACWASRPPAPRRSSMARRSSTLRRSRPRFGSATRPAGSWR